MERNSVLQWLPEEIKPYFAKEQELYKIDFPIENYPTKINSLNLEKTPFFTGKLNGIKGQYLLFEDGTVFNIRSNEGIVVKMEV